MERSPEIEGVLRRFLRSFAGSDEDALRALSSAQPGRRAIGTDPREWVSDAAWELMYVQLPELAAVGGLQMELLESEGYEEGGVGWGAANFRWGLAGQPAVPARLTGVFRLEDGPWRAVQVHFSLGVLNEEVGMALTVGIDAVAEAVQAERPGLGSAVAPDGTVTLLFTDIEGSTVLAERLGDERWAELCRWHRAETTDAASANRGYVVKSLGDGFMIAFPSASDALRCAIAVQRSVDDGWEGNDLRVRAGVHSGDAVRDIDDFFGHAVTVAARVAALAHGGEILTTRVVQELVRGGPFAFSNARMAELKGIDGEIEIAAVVSTS